MLWNSGGAGASLTGLMSRCRKPTEWMASMDSRICLPSRSVVLSVKVPRGWLRRRSARFRPWGWGCGHQLSGHPGHYHGDTLPSLIPKACAHSPLLLGPQPHSSAQEWQHKLMGESGGRMATGTHLELHHHIVKLLIPATANEPAHMVFP